MNRKDIQEKPSHSQLNLEIVKLLKRRFGIEIGLKWMMIDKGKGRLRKESLLELEEVDKQICRVRGRLLGCPEDAIDLFERYGLPSNLGVHIRNYLPPEGFEYLIEPGLQLEFIEEMPKLMYNCLLCAHLDGRAENLYRMKYYCIKRNEFCFDAMDKKRVCKDFGDRATLETSAFEKELFLEQMAVANILQQGESGRTSSDLERYKTLEAGDDNK